MQSLFHGSNKIIRRPQYGKGNPFNDYGLGFYCTREPEIAKEWACSSQDNGFSNEYQLDDGNLSCLNLNGNEFHILNWLAVLMENRRIELTTPLLINARQYLLDNFLPDYKGYDLIQGYRADDSYFSFTRAFLSNSITLEQLSRAMRLGKLGEQIVLRSPKAFNAITFVGASPVDASVYHVKRTSRDNEARQSFVKMLSEQTTDSAIYISTIIREKWTNDDPRL